MTATRPIGLGPVLLDKVWGGHALAAWGFPAAATQRVGEAWIVADVRSTSISGAGGGAVQSPLAVIRDGAHTLGDLVDAEREALLGAVPPSDDGFPLLIKLLDAREHVSVQVHPSEAYATTHPSARVKHECWHVLAAAPGAVLFLGVRPGTTPAALAAAVREGRVVDLLERVPAVAGDCHLLPSGLVHAMGAGVIVAEVQTPSDTTFRLYDWTAEYPRPVRTLHVEEAVAAADLTLRPSRRRPAADADGLAASTEAFDVFVRTLLPDRQLQPVPHASPLAVLALHGTAIVETAGGVVHVQPGAAAVVPAAARETLRIRTMGSAEVLLAEAKPPLVVAGS